MLVVSKFHDYYDVGMKLGIDKTVVYERNTTFLKGKKFPNTPNLSTSEWRCFVLAFCGKFYPFVCRFARFEIKDIVWDVEEAVNVLPKTNRTKYYSWDEYKLDTEKGIREFFDKKYPHLEKFYHEHRTPVFGFIPERAYHWRSKNDEYSTLVLNPNLKDLEFYKVKDPITAFQDIAMYMGGVIGAPPPPKEKIDDKVMAASKGHDGPYSFKKPPGKRGKNKWR